MVKVCEKEFPMGSFPRQKSDGFYMDGNMKDNIDILAKKIVDDMQFVGIGCSSTFGVRTGKSTFFQQIATYFTSKVNELHGVNNTFDITNVVFDSEALQKKAFQLPLYSVLILDEGDDLTASHWSKIARNLKRFFRKCGQLNLFILLILPDYFEIPRTYAISRSNFLIDIKFEGEFQRGFFEFYSFKQKKRLYIKGRKYGDYSVVKPSFYGKFPRLYTVDAKKYRYAKYLDMLKDDPEVKPEITELSIKIKYFNMVCRRLRGKLTIEQVAHAFGVSGKTGYRYIKREKEEETPEKPLKEGFDTLQQTNINNKLTNMDKIEEKQAVEPLIYQNNIESRRLDSIKAQGI